MNLQNNNESSSDSESEIGKILTSLNAFTNVLKNSEMKAVLDLFIKNRFMFYPVDETTIVFPSKLALNDHGLPNPEHLHVALSYEPDTKKWFVMLQLKIRKIDGNVPGFEYDTVKDLFDRMCIHLNEVSPHLDVAHQIPVVWDVNMDCTAIDNTSTPIAEIIGSTTFEASPESVFELLTMFDKLEEPRLIEVTAGNLEA